MGVVQAAFSIPSAVSEPSSLAVLGLWEGKKGPSGFIVGLARFPSVLLVEWVPCFTALRARVSTECWHAYASVTVFGKSREHVFLSGFLELTYC